VVGVHLTVEMKLIW